MINSSLSESAQPKETSSTSSAMSSPKSKTENKARPALAGWRKNDDANRLPAEEIYEQHARIPIETADMIIYNPVDDCHGFWSAERILKRKKTNCRLVKLPYATFGGYWLDDLHKPVNPLFEIGLPNIFIKEFLNTYGEVTSENISHFFPIIEIPKVNDTEELTIRERFQRCVNSVCCLYKEKSDIDFSDYFVDHCKREQLFVNIQHPTTQFFREVCIRILDCVGIPFAEDEILRVSNNMLDTYEQPILPCVSHALQLQFPLKTVVTFHGRKLSRQDYYRLYMLANFCDQYSRIDSVQLLCDAILRDNK